MKTVLITGTSSGFGAATTRFYLERGWNVIATMRDPDRVAQPLPESPNLLIARLDVQDRSSIASAIAAGIALASVASTCS